MHNKHCPTSAPQKGSFAGRKIFFADTLTTSDPSCTYQANVTQGSAANGYERGGGRSVLHIRFITSAWAMWAAISTRDADALRGAIM